MLLVCSEIGISKKLSRVHHPSWVRAASGSRKNRNVSDSHISLPWWKDERSFWQIQNQFESNQATKKWHRGAQKGLQFPKAISTLFWRSSKSVSIHTRSKTFPVQPRAATIYKATHSSCSAMSAAWHRRRKSRHPGLTGNVRKTSFSKTCKMTVLSMTSTGRKTSISSSYSHKMEKAVIKSGICTMGTSPPCTLSVSWWCFPGYQEEIDFSVAVLSLLS